MKEERAAEKLRNTRTSKRHKQEKISIKNSVQKKKGNGTVYPKNKQGSWNLYTHKNVRIVVQNANFVQLREWEFEPRNGVCHAGTVFTCLL